MAFVFAENTPQKFFFFFCPLSMFCVLLCIIKQCSAHSLWNVFHFTELLHSIFFSCNTGTINMHSFYMRTLSSAAMLFNILHTVWIQCYLCPFETGTNVLPTPWQKAFKFLLDMVMIACEAGSSKHVFQFAITVAVCAISICAVIVQISWVMGTRRCNKQTILKREFSASELGILWQNSVITYTVLIHFIQELDCSRSILLRKTWITKREQINECERNKQGHQWYARSALCFNFLVWNTVHGQDQLSICSSTI